MKASIQDIQNSTICRGACVLLDMDIKQSGPVNRIHDVLEKYETLDITQCTAGDLARALAAYQMEYLMTLKYSE